VRQKKQKRGRTAELLLVAMHADLDASCRGLITETHLVRAGGMQGRCVGGTMTRARDAVGHLGRDRIGGRLAPELRR